MPVTHKTAQRIRSGTYAVANITSVYAITALTIANDQYQGGSPSQTLLIPWLPPLALPDAIPVRSQISTMLDGTVRGDGFYQWTWTFSYWTFYMYEYWAIATVGSVTALSGLVSVMTYDVEDAAVYLNATAERPLPGRDMEAAYGGWQNIKCRFHHGTIIT